MDRSRGIAPQRTPGWPQHGLTQVYHGCTLINKAYVVLSTRHTPRGRLRSVGDSFSVNEKREGRRLLLAAFPKRKQRRSKEYYSGIIRVEGLIPPFNDAAAAPARELAVDTRGLEERHQSCISFCELCQSNKHEILRSGRFAAGHSCASLASPEVQSSSTNK